MGVLKSTKGLLRSSPTLLCLPSREPGDNLGTTQRRSSKELFLLNDDVHKEWCVYANEPSWKSHVDSSGADTVASMNFSDGQLTSIEVTTQDESGDWMIIDTYNLDNGDLKRLQRKANILPGDRSVTETFLIAKGKALLQNRNTVSLTTGKKLAGAEQWVPEVPIVTSLRDFPFAALTTLGYSDVLAKGKICVAAKGVAPPR